MKRRTWIKPELARAYRRIDRGWPGMTALLLHAVVFILYVNALQLGSGEVRLIIQDDQPVLATFVTPQPQTIFLNWLWAAVIGLTLAARTLYWARIALRSLRQRPWRDDAILILWQAVDRGVFGWGLLIVHAALFYFYMDALGPREGIGFVSSGQTTVPVEGVIYPRHTLFLNTVWAAVIGFTLIVRTLRLAAITFGAITWTRRVFLPLVSICLVIATAIVPWLAWLFLPLAVIALLLTRPRRKADHTGEDQAGRKRKRAEQSEHAPVPAYAIDHDGELMDLTEEELALIEAHRATHRATRHEEADGNAGSGKFRSKA
jgi:hypothetical protein